ncbi:endonuclease MutS2 [Spirochaetia bacterium]|nr:endonuclease MutS2 [Spirochaetia bacterium]
MNEKTLALLEFEAIRSAVAAFALSGEAAARVEASLPFTNPAETRELKLLVSRVLDRTNSGDEEPTGQLPDIAAIIPKLDVEGASLEQDEAYALGVFTERGEALKAWLAKGEGLAALLAGIPDCSVVAKEVFRVFDREGKLRDLPEFREIKRRIRALQGDLETAVARYSATDESRRMLQSGLPSQRDGRMVLALKANFRGRIKGIVHEVSATGQTLFVEPEDVVEKNNDIIIEQRRLDAEIRRVLRQMTDRIAENRENLRIFHEKLIFIETIRARARYSRDIHGHFALEPAASGALILKQARHPLLGRRAVPIDFTMGRSFPGETGAAETGGAEAGDAEGPAASRDIRTVIITGPNTGGKTVALKTVGLFALMNQFGLALPAEEGTRLPVFDGIYADIGDEQSLSQSLSTFSAHMTNIAAIAQSATADSLILLDELGSGTDPQEGSAIAMAILDHLIEKGSRLIVTTHHGVLKNYGYTRLGVENASVEFDSRTLSPTYRIVMGIPGESRAVDIAERNGLPAEIVRAARAYLADERSDVSALITELKQKHQDLDSAAQVTKSEALKLREERRKADLRELRLKQKELEMKEGGMGQFRLLLAESRKKLENLVREVKEGELTREKTLKVKEFLKELEETVSAEDAALETEKQYLSGESAVARDTTVPILPGMEVLAGEFKRRGTVIRPDKKTGDAGNWIVEIGSLRLTMNEKDLSPLPPSQIERKPLIAPADLAGDTQAKFEISLRGMRMDEALEALQRQMDAAVLSGLGEFSVVHGKGDGILQRAVHEYLKHQNQVADYYFSRPELGGFGRTEVILKR